MASSAGSTAGFPRPPTMLEQLLEEINFQRTKEMRQLLKDDSGFVMLQGTTYWTDLFVRHFLFQADHTIDGDDLLFFVRKKHIKTSSRYLPKFETEVDVFRKDSKKLPIGDPDIDWEETVYLNLVVHQFNYTLTLAICTRTSPKELQVLRRHSQKVYASPSRRRMDAKGDLEEMTYPHICFMVDNFDEVFCDILVRDGEMVCVELVASDREGAVQGVIFLGSIRYDALKKVYDARSSLSTKMAQKMTFGLFSGASSQRIEFVRMKGPQGKGHAEMAVTKPKGSGAETPTSEPGYSVTDALWDADWDDAEELFMYRHQRRLSDPSANLNNFVRGGWKTKPDTAGSKARSENEGLDSMANGLNEIEAGDVRDVKDEACSWGGRVASPVQTKNRRTARTRRRETYHERRKNHTRNLDDDHKSPKRAGTPKGRDSRPYRNHHIEVGSETFQTTSSESLTDDNVMQKLDTGAILVNGKEELPLDLENNRRSFKKKNTSNINKNNKIDKYDLKENHGNFEEEEDNDEDKKMDLKENNKKINLKKSNNYRPRRYFSDDEIGRKNKRLLNDDNASDIEDLNNERVVCNNGHDKNANATLPRRQRRRRRRRRALSGSVIGNHPLPPHRVTPDGTAIYYYCEVPRRPGSQELDDGAYNPLWTMRGFTQTFHFWKETRRAQSVPLNAFLTYITLPWWSIAKDILDHREDPILTF